MLASSLGLLAVWPQVLAAQEHAHRAAASGKAELAYLDRAAADEIEAIAAQIIPTDDTPGAREAGVIYFIDHALNTFDRDQQDDYRTGLADLQTKRLAMFPGSQSIAALTSGQQLALVRAIENTPFFETIRTHTILGFLATPDEGGNRNMVGWKLLGMEGRMVYEPPFGYYDAHPEETR